MNGKMKLKSVIFVSNLVLFVIFVVILVICSFAVNSHYLNSQLSTSMTKEHSLVENSLNTIIRSAQEYINVLSLDFRLQDALSELAEQENVTQAQQSRVSSIMGEVLSNVINPGTSVVGGVITYDNEIVYSGYSISAGEAMRVLGDDFLNDIEESGDYIWSGLKELNYVGDTPRNVFAIGKKIVNKSTGRHIGECILFVDERVVYETINYNETLGEIIILDSDNNIISNSDPSFLFESASSKYPFLSEQELGTEGVRNSPVDYSVTKFNDWKIVNIPETDFFSESLNTTLIYIALIIASYLVFNLILSNVLTLRVVRSVGSIHHKLSLASGGDLSVRMTDEYPGELKAIATGFNYLMDTINDYIDRIYSQEQQKNELEFKVLQAQINPHFLYNTIETISSFITLDRKKEAKKTALSLANFYKLCLSKGQEFIPVREEIELVKAYIDIQSLRYSDYVTFEVDIKDIDDCYIPKLTLQPIIENALYHGVKESDRKGIIKICGYKKESMVFITIEDNGVGIDDTAIQKALSSETENNSFGLFNINSRLKLKYGDEFGVAIKSELGEFTRVTVSIPEQKMRRKNGSDKSFAGR